MTGGELPDNGHVVRYVKPSYMQGGEVDGAAFVPRKDEFGVSVHWLEAFGLGDLDRQMMGVRQVFRLRPSRHGRFAKLSVGGTKRDIELRSDKTTILSFKSAPLEATEDFPFDPSHAEIRGFPEYGTDQAMVVGDLIADCVETALIPATTSQ